MSTVQENTEWIEKWIINDPEFYDAGVDAAGEGAYALESFLRSVLDAAFKTSDLSGAMYTAQEMTESDYQSVDWEEIRNTLLS